MDALGGFADTLNHPADRFLRTQYERETFTLRLHDAVKRYRAGNATVPEIRFILSHERCDATGSDMSGRTVLCRVAPYADDTLMHALLDPLTEDELGYRKRKVKVDDDEVVIPEDSSKDKTLEAIVNWSCKPPPFATPLYVAAEYNNEGAVRHLLRAGAKPNLELQTGSTPLMVAAQKGHVNIAMDLINAGANIHHSNRAGTTALHLAAQHGQREMVKLLLAYQASVEACNARGCTPLYLAIQRGHLEVVDTLLEAGASATALHRDQRVTPLFSAAQFGHVEVMKRLVAAGASIHTASCKGWRPMYGAAVMGHVPAMEYLASLGASVDDLSDQHISYIYIASERGSLGVLDFILARGGDVNRRKANGTAPLFIAAQQGWTRVCDRLLEWGASASQAKADGATPLTTAAKHGHKEIVKLLVQHGAEMNVVYDQETPLQAALTHQRYSTASALVTLGADPLELRLDEYDSMDSVVSRLTESNNRALAAELLAERVSLSPQAPESGLSAEVVAYRKSIQRKLAAEYFVIFDMLDGISCSGRSAILPLLTDAQQTWCAGIAALPREIRLILASRISRVDDSATEMKAPTDAEIAAYRERTVHRLSRAARTELNARALSSVAVEVARAIGKDEQECRTLCGTVKDALSAWLARQRMGTLLVRALRQELVAAAVEDVREFAGASWSRVDRIDVAAVPGQCNTLTPFDGIPWLLGA